MDRRRGRRCDGAGRDRGCSRRRWWGFSPGHHDYDFCAGCDYDFCAGCDYDFCAGCDYDFCAGCHDDCGAFCYDYDFCACCYDFDFVDYFDFYYYAVGSGGG